MVKKISFILPFLIVLMTFDSIVFPFIRLSIADLIFIFISFNNRISKIAIKKIFYFLMFFCVPLIIINTFQLIYNQTLHINTVSVINSNFGFIRPILYTVLSINFYQSLINKQYNIEKLFKCFSIAGIVLTLIVFFQFLGLSFPMYHNNPSFGEIGRWTFFNLGYRPTGLSNEASFVGIYLILILSLVIYLKSRLQSASLGFLKYSDLIIIAGVFFTTSRLALLVGAFFFLLKASLRLKLIGLFLISSLFYFNTSTIDRFNVFFDGSEDNSTLERFGSNLAYIDALKDQKSFIGTGYLNANSVVSKHIDSKVELILGNRTLPSFSLPLQIAVEFGFFGIIIIFFSFVVLKKTTFSLPFLAFLSCSLLTGVQNFLFTYFFITIVVYVRNNSHFK